MYFSVYSKQNQAAVNKIYAHLTTPAAAAAVAALYCCSATAEELRTGGAHPFFSCVARTWAALVAVVLAILCKSFRLESICIYMHRVGTGSIWAPFILPPKRGGLYIRLYQGRWFQLNLKNVAVRKCCVLLCTSKIESNTFTCVTDTAVCAAVYIKNRIQHVYMCWLILQFVCEVYVTIIHAVTNSSTTISLMTGSFLFNRASTHGCICANLIWVPAYDTSAGRRARTRSSCVKGKIANELWTLALSITAHTDSPTTTTTGVPGM